MRGNVPVGVSFASVLIGKEQSQQPTGLTLLDGVHIGTDAHPGQCAHWTPSVALRIASANVMSSVVVILKANRSPSTT
ncbi:Uncharacterised protein [Mycobacteroides abscessus subsp. abscessus]|nr:Uncharacterised protein [Mycobacteroides abscessus subsp. abscessus]